MSEPFYKRFNIDVGTKEAHQRFIQRIRTLTWTLLDQFYSRISDRLLMGVCFKLGKPYSSIAHVSTFMGYWDEFVENDFRKCLETTEAVKLSLPMDDNSAASKFSEGIKNALEESEVDLEISWDGEIFTRKGAQFLDEQLVNDPLHWLRNAKYQNVLTPFEKGLKHWMEGQKDEKRYGDVITDMYEAAEALAKIVTGRETDLSGNLEKFASELRLPDQYKRMLKEYDSFANEYRHSAKLGKPRKYPSESNTEVFIYLTGTFIRLVVQPK